VDGEAPVHYLQGEGPSYRTDTALHCTTPASIDSALQQHPTDSACREGVQHSVRAAAACDGCHRHVPAGCGGNAPSSNSSSVYRTGPDVADCVRLLRLPLALQVEDDLPGASALRAQGRAREPLAVRCGRCMRFCGFCCVCTGTLFQALAPWMLSVIEVGALLLLLLLLVLPYRPPGPYSFDFRSSLEDVVLLGGLRAAALAGTYAYGSSSLHLRCGACGGAQASLSWLGELTAGSGVRTLQQVVLCHAVLVLLPCGCHVAAAGRICTPATPVVALCWCMWQSRLACTATR
jgi:hypothetical protein